MAIVGGGLGGLVVVRALRRRFRRKPPEARADADPRAEELRRKLDESRAVVDDREEFESAETPVDAAESLPDDLDERRRQVHERARARADQMRSSTED
jgi:cation diffusion facilitator CzcD-associated flavoprotein CzcO